MIDSCFINCIFSNDSVHGHLLGNVTRSALGDEAFAPVLSVIVGVAILSATALLLLITVIVSIPTLCLIIRWVYTIMHSSMHYARVSVRCVLHLHHCMYILAHLCHFRRRRRAKQKVCVRAYDVWPLCASSGTMFTIMTLVFLIKAQTAMHACSNCIKWTINDLVNC